MEPSHISTSITLPGTGEEEDVFVPTLMEGKQLKDKKVLTVSSGGQHSVLIVKS